MNIAKDLVNALNGKKGTKAYDTQATITRIEDGTAWVHIPGGVDETPVKLTINATEGQTVQVRVADGTAFLVGNESSPPTDDRMANIANNTALNAEVMANSAIASAESAAQAAAEAWDSAQEASTAASQAQTSADNAQTSATTANTAANNALQGLSTVESVVDVVNWFAEHKTATTDTTVQSGKAYYIYDDVTGSLTKVDPTGTENPAQEGWYELDEAVAEYVGTHVATTDDGLSVIDVANGWRVLISSGGGNYDAGVYIIDPNGNVRSSFGTSVKIGSLQTGGFYTEITSDAYKIWWNNKTITEIGYGIKSQSQGSTTYVPFYSFTPGRGTGDRGMYSFAQGISPVASGYGAVSEGYFTTASGEHAVAFGDYTTASGDYSLANGAHTIAQRKYQTVVGSYNVADTGGTDTTTKGNYVFIVGNGTASGRSNALTVGWDGNVEIAGQLKCPQNKYYSAGGAIDLRNGDIANCNAIYMSDKATSYAEAINWKHDDNMSTQTWDSVWANSGNLYFAPNSMSGAYRVYHTGSIEIKTSETIGTDGNITSGTNVNKGSFKIPAGKGVLVITAWFATNATGRREIWLSDSAGGSEIIGAMRVQVAAVSGSQTRTQLVCVVNNTAEKTYYLTAYQNSGSALSCAARYSYLGVNV